MQATVTSSAAGQTALTASLDPNATECGDGAGTPDPLDAGKFALLYAGAQKNLGPSGVTLVLIRGSWLAERA